MKLLTHNETLYEEIMCRSCNWKQVFVFYDCSKIIFYLLLICQVKEKIEQKCFKNYKRLWIKLRRLTYFSEFLYF